ncbi:MAG: amidohydrolase [Actinomycetes bacterium]
MTTVVRNARVWTADPSRPWAEAFVIDSGRITAIGSDSAISSAFTGSTTIDAGGQLVIPGIIDSHNHIRLGSGDGAVQLAGAKSLAQIRHRIAEWLDENPGSEWVYGEGFDYAALPDGRRPRASDLEGACGGRPAMLLDYSVHAAWFNREALAALGVGSATTHVPYGEFEHDPDTGELTGYLNDYATYGLSRAGLSALEQLVPVFSKQAQYARVRAGLHMAAGFGITTIVEPQNSLDDLVLFQQARDQGELRSRVIAALFHPVGTTDAELDEFAASIAEHRDDHFRVGPIKLYIDDIIEPHTAAMFEPYANKPETNGRTYYDQDTFDSIIARLDARGMQCFVHATGDRGNHMVLNAFEHARKVNGTRDSRHQIVHVESLQPTDIPRFAELGVVACMQPRHCGPEIIEDWRANVGPQRWRYAWPMRSLMNAAAPMAFSSDWNVAEMDPMVGLYSAATRASLDGTQSWVPEETIPVEAALRAYTTGGAWANFCDSDRGSLTQGRLADFVILSNDIFSTEPAALLETRAELTVVGGEIVHAI